MAIVTWGSKKISLIGYLEKGKNVTGLYYLLLSDRMKTELHETSAIGPQKVLLNIEL